MSFHQRQQWQFDKVRMQFSHILGNDHGERRDPTPMAWTLMDIRDGLSVECEVCLPTWLRARCMGPGRLATVKKQSQWRADAWFFQVWKDIAVTS